MERQGKKKTLLLASIVDLNTSFQQLLRSVKEESIEAF